MRPGEQSKNLRMSVIVVVVAEYFFSVAVHARTLLAVVPVFYGSGADGPAPRVWILSAGRHRSFESDSSHSTNAVGAWTAYRSSGNSRWTPESQSSQCLQEEILDISKCI